MDVQCVHSRIFRFTRRGVHDRNHLDRVNGTGLGALLAPGALVLINLRDVRRGDNRVGKAVLANAKHQVAAATTAMAHKASEVAAHGDSVRSPAMIHDPPYSIPHLGAISATEWVARVATPH